MKITSIDIIDVANDFASATSKWRPVVVKINTDEGISGFGEVGLPTASAPPQASAWQKI